MRTKHDNRLVFGQISQMLGDAVHGQVMGAGDPHLPPFVEFAYVEQQGRLFTVQRLMHSNGRHLWDMDFLWLWRQRGYRA